MKSSLGRSLKFAVCFLVAGVWLFPSHGFAAQEKDVYELIPAEKSLLTSLKFVLIDDFNAGKNFKNSRDAFWQSLPSKNGRFGLSVDAEDGRNAVRGHSLRVDFNLMPGGEAAFQTTLNRLDVSRAESFIFKYKLQLTPPNDSSFRLKVRLVDWKHKTTEQDVTGQTFSGQDGWRTMILPISLFENLDLDQLFLLQFKLSSAKQKTSGVLWLDEIAFFGSGNLDFDSHRDNITGFPETIFSPTRREALRAEKDDRKLMEEIARDTWKFFENARDKKTHLIVDHFRAGKVPLIADYTSCTNIGMDLLSIVSARELGILSRKEAEKKVRDIFSTLQQMVRYQGFFYNFYDTTKLSVTRKYISTIDSAWLAVAFVVVRQAFDGEIAKEATKFIEANSFNLFMDPENNQLLVGIDVPEQGKGTFHYGMLATEARMASFYAIGKGDVAEDHWWFLYRTPPEAWKWQTQTPRGKEASEKGIDYFQGYYEYQGKKVVPSWGGSLFEFLMPTLVLREKELAPKGLGLNDRIATELHRDYALIEKKYPVWGISPASTSNGKTWKYEEYGVKVLGVKGYPDRGVITPHASFLALDPLPVAAIANIRKFLEFEAYGEYGFYDSMKFPDAQANTQYLALDQGMAMVALCNYLKKGAIQKFFHKDPIAKKAEALLTKESFFS